MNRRTRPLLVLLIGSSLLSCQPAAVPSPTPSPIVTPEPARTEAASPTSRVTPSPAQEPLSEPTARGYHRMVHVGGEFGVLLFSGYYTYAPLEQIARYSTADAAWAYTPTGGWTDLGLVGIEDVPPLNDAVYDSGSGLVVLLTHGGTRLLPDVPSPTYVYDPATNSVEQRALGAPVGMLGLRAAYDAESDRVITFGGIAHPSFSAKDETWAYDVDTDTWTQMEPEFSPSRRGFQAMAYHPRLDRIVLFGGMGSGERALGDTWAYDYNTDTWTEMSPETAPDPRYYATMVYDAVTDRMILFGGTDVWERAQFGDTWAYDLETDTWTELDPPVGPDTRAWHAMAADPHEGVIILFSGGASRTEYVPETWLYDPASNTWSLVP